MRFSKLIGSYQVQYLIFNMSMNEGKVPRKGNVRANVTTIFKKVRSSVLETIDQLV